VSGFLLEGIERECADNCSCDRCERVALQRAAWTAGWNAAARGLLAPPLQADQDLQEEAASGFRSRLNTRSAAGWRVVA
jgi:hypothetical protein